MKNKDIRKEIKEAGVKLWQIAEKLNINDGNLSRKLRKELPEEMKQQIRLFIAEIKAGEANEQ